jgi:hypothetical protein
MNVTTIGYIPFPQTPNYTRAYFDGVGNGGSSPSQFTCIAVSYTVTLVEELTQRKWEVTAMVFFHVDIEASGSKDFSQYPSQNKICYV